MTMCPPGHSNRRLPPLQLPPSLQVRTSRSSSSRLSQLYSRAQAQLLPRQILHPAQLVARGVVPRPSEILLPATSLRRCVHVCVVVHAHQAFHSTSARVSAIVISCLCLQVKSCKEKGIHAYKIACARSGASSHGQSTSSRP